MLRDQDARKASLEQRGLAVVTTSGAIVTLLFGLVAVLTKTVTFELPKAGEQPLFWSLILFTVAAVAGVGVNVPLNYRNVDLSDEARFWRWWDAPARSGDERIAITRVRAYQRARKFNGVKAWVLVAGVAAEVVAVGLLAATVAVILRAA